MDYKSVFENTQLSAASKRSYINKMKKMTTIYNNEIPSFDKINNDNNITINNKYAYINSILAYKKHKGLERDENEQRIYKDIYEKLKTFSNEPSIKQKENDLDYSELVNAVDLLISKKKYDEALLLGMYVLIEPLKADFGNVEIIYDKEDSDIYREEKEDHLFNNKIYLYNLKPKQSDEFIISIPPKLLDIIKESLNENMRNYLFINKEDNPFTNEGFRIYANRLLKKIFNKDITITDLRRIRINYLDINKLPAEEKINIADKINYSASTQEEYKPKYDDSKPINGGWLRSIYKRFGY
jgi:hypothetical protein